MPPVDNYISILVYFIEKPWQALDITMVGVYVQMWKWIEMIFLCDIFSGTRGMLKSLRNHRQSQRPNGKTWRIVGGRCWEKIVFHGHSIDCSYVCTSKQVGLEVNTIIEDVRGWQNSKRIELLSSDDPTPSSQIGWAAPRECNTRMRDPKCSP